jgi:glycosyltransferase involved in cell wall biosynthesis
MKVLMISGSYPPDACGIGDYTMELVNALRQEGVAVETLPSRKWNLMDAQKIVSEIRHSKCDIVHLQYPTEGYRTSLSPQWLSMRIPTIVTIHEYLNARVERRLASIPFFLFARHLVFTNKFELDGVTRTFPWVRKRSVVIPIGTNILPRPTSVPRDFNEVLYFGRIAPAKGLEQVLSFAQLAKQDGSRLGVHIVGTFPPRLRAYAESLMGAARGLPVRWTLDRSPSEVATILASSFLAYLPFPDGASERRGSLKAALASGLVSITTDGSQIPDALRKAVIIANSPEEAFAEANSLASDSRRWHELSAASLDYAQSFNWDSIARSHIQLYSHCLATNQ